MSKPEVVATTFTMAAIAAPSIGQQITHASVKVDMPAGTELIRLTDHEAAIAERDESVVKANAQAEHFEREWYLRGDALEAIESDRAADKAQIAELEQYNKSLDEENARLSADYGQACDDALSVARNLRTVEAERNELLGLLRDAVLIIDERIVLGENDDSFIYAINSALGRHKC